MTSYDSARRLSPSVLLAAMLFALATSAQASVVISNAATKHMSCSAGVCSPTAANAVLNTADLVAMLNASDVEVTTGSGAVTIGVTSPLSWASSNRLTLDAQHGISIRSTVIVEGTGGLTMTIDDGAAGKLNFYPGASVTFWDLSSSLVINGNAYTLVGDIATLASDIAANPSGFYALAKDYDASPDGTYTASPIQTVFSGAMEGLGHVISNLSIAISTYTVDAGLFSTIAGSVQDLGMAQGNVTCRSTIGVEMGILAGQNSGTIDNAFAGGFVGCAKGYMVGGLVGHNNGGTIIHSSATASASGDIVGSLVGNNEGTISNSFATGSVSGTHYASGGLAGINGHIIDSSHATGAVNAPGGYAIGGLVGIAASGTVTHSYATGNVAGYHFVGGLVGLDTSSAVDSSFAAGTVSGENFVGGLLGRITVASAIPVTTNSYATGAVIGGAGADIGALVGLSDRGIVQESYATGLITGGKTEGGLIGGVKRAQAQDTYWDLDTTGISDPSRGVGGKENYPGVTGLTDVQLKSQLPSGFDPAIWGQDAAIDNGYPYLLANPPQ